MALPSAHSKVSPRKVTESVAAARTQTEIASLGVKQAKAALLPQARLGGAFTYNSPSSESDSRPSYAARTCTPTPRGGRW